MSCLRAWILSNLSSLLSLPEMSWLSAIQLIVRNVLTHLNWDNLYTVIPCNTERNRLQMARWCSIIWFFSSLLRKPLITLCLTPTAKQNHFPTREWSEENVVVPISADIENKWVWLVVSRLKAGSYTMKRKGGFVRLLCFFNLNIFFSF